MKPRLGLFASFSLICASLLFSGLFAGVNQASASDAVSRDLAQALAKSGTQLGNPIMIRIVKLTQAEFDEHPPDLHDSCGPRHPSPKPTEYIQYNSDSFGNTHWDYSSFLHANNEMHQLIGEVQVWIRSDSGQYVLLKTFQPKAFSGGLGPKTMQGDGQTPEGFYNITSSQLKPYGHSTYGEAIDLGYPNDTYDRAHGFTGKQIEIHGNGVTIGCFAMGDQVRDIYSLVDSAQKDGQKKVPVEIFPFPLTDSNLNRIPDSSACASKLINFWKMLQPAYTDFQETRLPATISNGPNGNYVVNPPLPDMGTMDRVKSIGTMGCPTCTTR